MRAARRLLPYYLASVVTALLGAFPSGWAYADDTREDADYDEPAAETRADTAPPRPAQMPIKQIFAAYGCYINLNYECTIEGLRHFPTWYRPIAPGVLPEGLVPDGQRVLVLESGRILAVSFLALGRDDEADEVFVWLLGVDPEFILSGSEVAPSFVARFLSVRADWTAARLAEDRLLLSQRVIAAIYAHDRGGSIIASAEVWEPPYVPPPPPRIDIAVRVSTRFVALAGNDRDIYGDAFGFGLQLDVSRQSAGWVFGTEVMVTSHDVLLDNLVFEAEDSLNVLQFAGLAGYELRWGALGVRPTVAAGLTSFGLGEIVGKLGIAGGLGGLVNLYLGPQLIASANAGLRSVVVFDRLSPLSSNTFELGLQAGARF